MRIVSDVDIAVLAVDGCFDSGLSAVVDVLGTANALRQDVPAPPTGFTVTIVGLRRQVRTGNGLTVNPVLAKKMAQHPDLLVMPALGVKTPQEIIDTVRGHAALDLIRDNHANGTELAGACTGTFFLAESGVLDGRLATTSWWLGPAFRSRYPAVHVDETRIIARDARITTAGAAFAHIDLALSIVQQHSPSLADLTARYLLTGDRPVAGSVRHAGVARPDRPDDGSVRKVGSATTFRTDPHISAAARDLGISERTLQRTTASVVGMSPLHFIQQVRLDEATFLLRDTPMSMSAIAAAVGYRDAGTLRALVRKRRNSTLRALRAGRPS